VPPTRGGPPRAARLPKSHGSPRRPGNRSLFPVRCVYEDESQCWVVGVQRDHSRNAVGVVIRVRDDCRQRSALYRFTDHSSPLIDPGWLVPGDSDRFSYPISRKNDCHVER
jgi:hypothetical protein